MLAALFYYALPMVGHFSFADMKTENAILFFGVLGLMSVVLYLYGNLELDAGEEKKRNWRWLLLAGIFFSAGFATKPTIVLLFFMGGIIFTAEYLGAISGLGVTLISLGVISKFGGASLMGISRKILGVAPPSIEMISITIFFGIGALLFFAPFLPFRIPKVTSLTAFQLRAYVIHISIVFVGFMVVASPWMVRNMYINGHVSPSSALEAPNAITPQIYYSQEGVPANAPAGSRGLPKELTLDPNHEMCKGTARTEELDRYWGYRSGWTHYVGLPWRVVMNRDSQGYYLTTSPLLLILPLLLLYPAFWKRRPLRLLFWGTMLYVFEWI